MRSIVWTNGAVRFIDQTRLPLEESYVTTSDVDVIIAAIRSLSIRGAPLIGIAAAYGLAAAALRTDNSDQRRYRSFLQAKLDELRGTRPTAVNLSWALARMQRILERGSPALASDLVSEARKIHEEDIESCREIAANGEPLIPDLTSIITHCNTGFLATGGEGTALAVLAHAHRSGKRIHVYVDETRPLFQGARLTMWELQKLGIPATLITDSTAASVIGTGKVRAAIVGADRIAANGDTANKVGTYGLAILARYHNIPFYVAAPDSSIDHVCRDGSSIVIEHRDPSEVCNVHGTHIAPQGASVESPAFDVTPAELITAIITDRGVFHPPFSFSQGG